MTLRRGEPGADAEDLCTPGPCAASNGCGDELSTRRGGHQVGPPTLMAPGLCGWNVVPDAGCTVIGWGARDPGASAGLTAAVSRRDASAEWGRSALPRLLFGST